VLEDRKLALRCLERVLTIDPDNEQAKRGMAWLRSQKGDKAAPLPPLLSDAESTQLVVLLKHPQEPIVVKAVRYLGQAGGARAVEPLLSLLMSTKSKALQAEARTALIAIGTPSVDPVQQRLNPTRTWPLNWRRSWRASVRWPRWQPAAMSWSMPGIPPRGTRWRST